MVRKGIILSYHRVAEPVPDPWGLRVSPENFERQLQTIKQRGSPSSLSDFLNSYTEVPPHNPQIVLTFDDGYVDNLFTAVPLLEKYEIPATVFITTGCLDKRGFWWEDLENIFLRSNVLPRRLAFAIDSDRYEWDLGAAAEYSEPEYARDLGLPVWRGVEGSRLRLYHDIYSKLWSLPLKSRLQAVEQIISWSGLDPAFRENNRPLTMPELGKLAKSELITIGAHSVNHMPLDGQTRESQAKEIKESKSTLENLLDKKIDFFAYPHGKFDQTSIEILRESGFLGACTTAQDFVNFETDSFRLPRFQATNSNDVIALNCYRD